MILEIIFGALLLGAAAVLIEEIIDWAANVIDAIADAAKAILWAVKRVYGAIFKVYTQKRNGKWLETTREISENELPEEIRRMGQGQKREVARWN